MGSKIFCRGISLLGRFSVERTLHLRRIALGQFGNLIFSLLTTNLPQCPTLTGYYIRDVKLTNVLETSLIGKALDFGPSEYGFEPHVSRYMVAYNTYSYFLSHVNLAIKKKHAQTTVRYSKHAHQLLNLLHKVGCIHNYIFH